MKVYYRQVVGHTSQASKAGVHGVWAAIAKGVVHAIAARVALCRLRCCRLSLLYNFVDGLRSRSSCSCRLSQLRSCLLHQACN